MGTKVGIYCRLSEEDKDKTKDSMESESIQNQKRMLLEYALNNDWDIIDIYVDEDYSGAGVYRPAFEKIIADAKSGKIEIVLCKSQSRFSRDLEVVERYINNKFKEWNVRFISLVDHIDTSKVGNKKSSQILGLTNEWYLEDLSENIKKTIRSKKEAGQFTGSFAPYGYIRSPEDKHKLVIDSVAAITVKEIFKKYRQGYGYTKIAKYLNEKKIASPYEYKKANSITFLCNKNKSSPSYWNSDTIAKIVKDEVYIGNLVQGKTKQVSYKNKKKIKIPREDWIVVKHTHEPIIDMETWSAVSKKFEGRAKPKNTGNIHMFSRKVYCGDCGKIFYQSSSKSGNGSIFYYLGCKSVKSGLPICNNNHAIRVDLLEAFLLSEMNKYIKRYHNAEILAKKLKEIEKNTSNSEKKVILLQKEKNQLEQSIHKKNQYLKKTYEDQLEGFITNDEYKIFRDDYRREIKDFESRITILQHEISSLEKNIENKMGDNHIFNKYQKIPFLDNRILNEFIDKIYIGVLNKETKEREIRIEWTV